MGRPGVVLSSLALILLSALIPQATDALQLRWSTGGSDLSFSSARRCTLVIEADVAEARLPSDWRLTWVGDGVDLRPIALDSASVCGQATAQVYRVEGPSNPSEAAGNLTEVHFCSTLGTVPSMAWEVFDLPAGGRGRLRVVGCDSTGAANGPWPRVIMSNEVTLNGGVSDPYPPVVLQASTSHSTTQFEVRTVGVGLPGVIDAMAQAPDSVWSLPLEITERSDTGLTAVADVHASMPASVLWLAADDGTIAVTPLPPDGSRAGIEPDFEALADSCEDNHCYYFDPDPNVQPRDFAFFYGIASSPPRGLFHLFYIRRHKNATADNTTRSFGHAWSHELRNWASDTSAAVFSVSANAWDRSHVWAPSIMQVGPLYHMSWSHKPLRSRMTIQPRWTNPRKFNTSCS